MNLPVSSPALFENVPFEQVPFEHVLFVLHRPSHPGNVGAAARALKTMGFGRLALVAPKHENVCQHPDAIALASGATDVLAQAQVFIDLPAALAHSTLAIALTARARELAPPAGDIRQSAALCRNHLFAATSNRLALVLGTERSGLTNADVALCQRVCHIPANPHYSSLNLAQAVQLLAWELRYALLEGAFEQSAEPAPASAVSAGELPASHAQVQALVAHWQEALTAVGFLDPQHPKKLMRRMQHLLARAQLTQDETAMLRGVCSAMIKAAHPQNKDKDD